MKFMKDPEQVAKKITENIAAKSFKLFRDKKFRRLNNFENIDQVEQDRIFNEIVLTGLALAILTFENLEKRTRETPMFEQYFRYLQLEMANYYGNWLNELGSKPSDVELWKKLVKMRCDEYKKDEKRFLRKKNSLKNEWPHITAIGGFRHITRGKGKPEDELFIIFIRWIAGIYENISKSIL